MGEFEFDRAEVDHGQGVWAGWRTWSSAARVWGEVEEEVDSVDGVVEVVGQRVGAVG